MWKSIIRRVSSYRIRPATIDDLDVLVHHRLAMFTELGATFDAPVVRRLYQDWLRKMMPGGEYRSWVCETATGDIAAGAGLTLLKWLPGPSSVTGDGIAFVYNVYTEPEHRKQGLARRLMDTIHDWCGQHGIHAVALNAAAAARHLYESQGYQLAPGPMMWKIL